MPPGHQISRIFTRTEKTFFSAMNFKRFNVKCACPWHLYLYVSLNYVDGIKLAAASNNISRKAEKNLQGKKHLVRLSATANSLNTSDGTPSLKKNSTEKMQIRESKQDSAFRGMPAWPLSSPSPVSPTTSIIDAMIENSRVQMNRHRASKYWLCFSLKKIKLQDTVFLKVIHILRHIRFALQKQVPFAHL